MTGSRKSLGNILPPMFEAVVYAHPLRQTPDLRGFVEVGHSLADLGAGGQTQVWIDGELVTDLSIRPGEGQHVLFRTAPAGGGDGEKNVLQIVATIAIIVLSRGAGAQAALAWGETAGYVATAAVGIAGSLALNALIPPPNPALGLDDPFSLLPGKSLTGSRNTIAPLGPINRLYGKHRFFPSLASRPYTDRQGDLQFLNLLFCLGYGPLAIDGWDPAHPDDLAGLFDNIKIGSSKLSTFDPSTIQVVPHDGSVSGDTFGIFTRSVDEQALSLEFVAEGDTQTKATALNTRSVSLDVATYGASDAGLYELQDNTFLVRVLVGMKVEIRPVGTTPWTMVDQTFANLAVTGGKFATNFPISETIRGYPFGADVETPVEVSPPDVAKGPGFYMLGNEAKVFRMGISFDLPTVGSYEVRLTRIGAFWTKVNSDTEHWRAHTIDQTTDTHAHSRFTWTALRSFKSDTAVAAIDGFSFLEMRIQATDNLSGTLDNLSIVAQSKLPVWNGSAYVLQATSNPAWIYRDVLIGSANARPVDVSRLDEPTLKAWGAYCDANGFEFNAPFDGRTTIFDALAAVAAQGRASFAMRDGKYSVTQDQIQNTPVQVFTPRNSWNFKGSRAYPKQPHALNVRFKNRDPVSDWQQDVRVVYNDGYSADGSGGTLVATEFDTLTLFGETSGDTSWKHGRYNLAVLKLRPELFTFEADFENIVATRGDRVQIQYDAILVGLGAGRVTAQSPSTNPTSITLDEQITIEVGKTYGVRIRRNDGVQIVKTLTNSAGTTNVLALSSAASGVNVGDLAAFGESGLETMDALVKSIAPANDLTATIEAVPYSPAVLTADSGPIPPYNPFVALPAAAPPAPIILNVLRGPQYALRSNTGQLTPRILVSYAFPGSSVPAASVQGALKPLGMVNFGSSIELGNNGQFAFVLDDDAQSYVIRLRGISDRGIPGPWTEADASAQDIITADITAITLLEQRNNPATPNGDLSTVVVTVTPPSDAAYSHALIDYRKIDQLDWFTVGPTDAQNTARQVLASDGITYEFRARAVSVSGYTDTGGPTAQITLSQATAGLPSNPDTGAPTLAGLNVTGLKVRGQPPGNGNFSGQDCTLDWTAPTMPAGKTFRDYRVQIINPANSHVIRTVYVVQPTFTYEFGMNVADALADGFSSPLRSFNVSVICRDAQGDISATPAQITASNPVPVLPGDFSYTAFFDAMELRFSRPTDDDFVGSRVYVSTTSGFTPGPSNLKYDGTETQPIAIGGLTSSTTYYFRIVLYDLFGAGSPSIEYSVTTAFLAGNDTTPPTVPGTPTLTSAIEQAQLYVTASLKASWSGSTDDSGSLFYEVEYWIDSSKKTTDQTTSTTYNIFPAEVGQTYSVRVRAIDYSGNVSAWSSTATLAISGDSTAPANVSSLNAVAGLDKIIISWVNPTDADFLETQVAIGTAAGFTPSAFSQRTRAERYIYSTPVAGGSYYIKVRTWDSSGNASAYSSAFGPVSPLTINATNVSQYIDDAGLTGAKLAAASIDATKFAAGITPVEIVSTLPTSGNFDGRTVFLTTDKKLYRYSATAGAFTASVAGADIVANSITAGQIAAGAISTTQLAAGAITADKIAAGTITADRLAVGDFSNQCDNADFELGDVNWTKGTNWTIASDVTNALNGTWRAARAANASASVLTNDLKVRCKAGDVLYARAYLKRSTSGNAGFVRIRVFDSSGAQLTNFDGNQISATSFTLSEVTATMPTNGVFASIEIEANNTSGTTYVDQAGLFRVSGSTLIQDGAITTAKIVTGAVTANEIAAATITGNKIAANTIDAGNINANAITTAKIAAGAVDATKINVSQLSAISADMGSITAGTITGALIRTAASGARAQLDSTNGVQLINASSVTTAKLAPDGSGFIGTGGAVMSWTAAGVLTIPGDLITTGTISGPLFKTTGTWEVDIGAQSLNLDGDGATTYVMAYRNGTTSKFRLDQAGNMRLGGDLQIASGGDLYSGKTSSTDSTHAGFWLGSVSGTPKFYIGAASDTAYLKWDGTALTVQGTIQTSGGTGTRIVMDSANSARYYDSTNTVIAQIGSATISSQACVANFGTLVSGNDASNACGIVTSGYNLSGIWAQSKNTDAIFGVTHSGNSGAAGVYGSSDPANTTGLVYGVRGTCKSDSDGAAAIYADGSGASSSSLSAGLLAVGGYGAILRQAYFNTVGGSYVLEAVSSNTSAPTHTAKVGTVCVRFSGGGGNLQGFVQVAGGFGGTGNNWVKFMD